MFIKIIDNPYNIGYGASLKRGIAAASNEIIVMTDADGTYPVEDIPKFLKYIDDHTIVSGVRGANDSAIPILRRPAKWFLTKLANFLTEMKIPDLNCGLRVIKKSEVTRYFHILPNRFSFTLTHLLASLTNGGLVKFIPINYYKRKGKSSIRPLHFFEFCILVFRIVTYFNPLKFFVWPGLIIFTIGFAYFLFGVIFHFDIYNGAVIACIAGLQIISMGLLADLIVKSRG